MSLPLRKMKFCIVYGFGQNHDRNNASGLVLIHNYLKSYYRDKQEDYIKIVNIKDKIKDDDELSLAVGDILFFDAEKSEEDFCKIKNTINFSVRNLLGDRIKCAYCVQDLNCRKCRHNKKIKDKKHCVKNCGVKKLYENDNNDSYLELEEMLDKPFLTDINVKGEKIITTHASLVICQALMSLFGESDESSSLIKTKKRSFLNWIRRLFFVNKEVSESSQINKTEKNGNSIFEKEIKKSFEDIANPKNCSADFSKSFKDINEQVTQLITNWTTVKSSRKAILSQQ